MHFARFLWRDRIQWGVVDGEYLRAIRGNLYRDARPGRILCSISEARILAPIDPYKNKVVGIAANYGEKDERDGPGIFMKQSGTIIGPGEPIVYPRICRSVIHEAEVGIVIGRAAKQVSEADALDYVLGYTCTNDVSAQDITLSDIGRGGTMRWKHFDTFCPIGPTIVTDIDGDNLRIQCRVNGRTDVDGSSNGMIWGVAKLINWVSEVMQLNPGDIISSGCPEVAEIKVGDTVEVEVEGIGILRNPVVAGV